MSETITWLHISDTHFCNARNGWDSEEIFSSFFNDLKKMEADYNLCPDLILFTGDVALGHVGNSCGLSLKDQYEEAEEFLEKIRNIFPKIPILNFFIVPGNHDVNRTLVTDDQTEWLEKLRKDKPENGRNRINKLMIENGVQWKRYIERLNDYKGFLENNGYKHLLEEYPDHLMYSTIRDINGFKVGIVGLNSAWSSYGGDEDKAKLWLGTYQISETCNKLKDTMLSIAIIHHPSNWFTDSEDLPINRKIENNFNFYLHGHEHQEWVTPIDKHTRIASGALYNGSEQKNGYNFVRLYPSENRGEVFLRTYNNGIWIPNIIGKKTNNEGIWNLKNLDINIKKKENVINSKSDVGSDSKPVQVLQPPLHQESTEIVQNVPYSRNLRFTGREDKLKQIHEALVSDNTVAISQPIAVCGLGGIGKTQIAVEYTYRYCDEYEFIFWVKADSEDSIISHYVVIAKLLNLPVKNDSDQNNIVSAVLNWFRTNDNWLLVFDNADDTSFVKKFLPPNPNGHILLTSRAPVFRSLNIARLVKIREMSTDEAKSFLLKRIGRVDLDQSDLDQSELEALEKLVHELGCLPLALEQAGAYIHVNNSSFRDYLVSYKKRGLRLLETYTIDKNEYSESISTTWSINFDEVRNNSEVSADILFTSAFLNPNQIPAEIFYKGEDELGPLISTTFGEADTDPLVFDEVLKPLWQYSLINREAGCRTYDIHRLVQAVIRDGMGKNEQKLWAERVVKALNHAFPEVEYENWELCDKLLPHAQTCAEYIGLWNIETKESAELLNATGSYLHKRARFKESESFLKSSLEIRKKVLEPEDFDMSKSLNDLGELYTDLGRYSEAEPLYLRALDIRKTTLSLDNPAIAESLNNLAGLYRILGRYSESVPLFANALEIRENIFKPDNPDIAKSLSSLAIIYRDLGRYSEAQPLCIRALEIIEKALGPEHPDVGDCLSNLAAVYGELGRYSEAEPLFTHALEITEKALGLEHPEIGNRLSNLASVYRDLGRYSEAESLFTRALEITEKALGPEHPGVGTRLSNLAAVYRDLGRYSEAESFFTRALEIIEESLCPEHRDVGDCLSSLALVYSDLGRYSEAKPLHTRALEIIEKALGHEHPNVGTCLNNLASVYRDLSRYSEAESHYTRALEIVENALGPEHPRVGICLNNLALLYSDLGRYSEAQPLCIRALEIAEKALGPEHPHVGTRLSNLAAVYRDLGQYSEAEPLFTLALEITEKALGSEHPDVGTCLDNLATVYSDLGRYSEAEPLCIRARKITEKTLGSEHPDVGTRLSNLALVYSDLGRYSEAEPLCIRALKITEKALGPEHPDVGNRLNNLAAVYSDLGRYPEAGLMYTRSLEIMERVFGPEHPYIAICLSNLASFFQKQQKYLKAKHYYEQAIEVTEKINGENSLKVANLLERYASLLDKMKRNREATTKRNRAKRIRSKIEKENDK